MKVKTSLVKIQPFDGETVMTPPVRRPEPLYIEATRCLKYMALLLTQCKELEDIIFWDGLAEGDTGSYQ